MNEPQPHPPDRYTRATVAALAFAALFAAVMPTAAIGQTFTNPIVPRGADPFAFQWGGQYFYTSTTGGDVRVARSPWLQNLNSNGRTVWNPPAASPYGQELWAPEIHRLDNKWYLYVAADDGVDANHRMFVLEGDSQDPQGSYTLKGQISIPDNRWAIDGTVFEHGGKDYFIWSGRRFSSGGGDFGSDQSLYIAEMSNPWTLTGTRVAISNPTLSWERNGHPVNEGPEILLNDNDVFLTYSASGFETPQYAIGALKLTGADPLLASSWTKNPEPLFVGAAGSGAEGTGHASFVKSPDGTQDWIVYHARASAGAPRDVRIQPFTFGGPGGLPQFGQPLPTSQPLAAPSGVPLVTFIPNLSFERGGTGWLDDFHAVGVAGAVDNDGSRFSKITGGDGPRVGYLGVGGNVDSALFQDIGPAHAGTYRLSLGLAIDDSQFAVAMANPAKLLLRLQSIGLHPGGSADESLATTLGELTIDTALLDSTRFTYFDITGLIPDGGLVGTWLRVGLYAPDELASGTQPWQATVDYMTLNFLNGSDIVPEPTAFAMAIGAPLLLLRRRRRQAA
jgi:GH43 family beta-xylosidase